MAWLLNLVYLAIMACAAPWLLYSALRKGKYREGWSERFLGWVPVRDSQRRCVWLHAVSVGEVNLLQTILAGIEREYPDWDVVISSTTAAGYALAKKRYAPRSVCYAPLDFSWAVNNVLKRVRPDLLLLAELEVWPNLLRAAKRQGVHVVVVNGRLGEQSCRGYRRLRWLVRPTFASIDFVAAQSEVYANRFRDLGCPANRVHVTGSLKFDGAQSVRGNPITQRLAKLADIARDDVVFLAGSTQAPEEGLALAAFEKLSTEFPRLKLILVPRHPERFREVAGLLDRRGLAWQRRSALTCSEFGPANVATDQRTEPPRILLVDAVGELGAWWGTAQIAFVGGSFGKRGGQNMIEPAAYGAAVSFGPNTWNFRDVVTLLTSNKAAVVVNNGDELERFVRRCLMQPGYAAELGRRAAQLVQQQQGATQQTMQLLKNLIDPPNAEVIRRIDAPQSPGNAATNGSATRRRAV